MNFLKSLFTSQADLEDRFMKSEIHESEDYRSAHSFYGYRSGVVKNPKECERYKIDDANC